MGQGIEFKDKSAKDIGHQSNKSVEFSQVKGIYIEKFRSLKGRYVELGKNLTIITGKNGTMKSSILGLIAHPFTSRNNAKDIFGVSLKTDMRDIFKLSFDTDSDTMSYYLHGLDSNGAEFYEKIRLYPRPEESRFRITVGRDNSAGLGNFSLNTSYISLKRLYPMIETQTKAIEDSELDKPYDNAEREWLSNAYYNIIQKKSFSETEAVSATNTKYTIGPKNTYYDFETISSGEDNLGAIFNKMLAFMRGSSKDLKLNGIFCIDEIEASLHPVSQIKLVDFILAWSKKYNIQVVLTTHSLSIIEHSMMLQNKHNDGKKEIAINNISTAWVGDDNNFNIIINPAFTALFKELTYDDLSEGESLYKVNVIFEDETAVDLFKQIFLRRNYITNHLNYISNLNDDKEGNSWKGITSLVKNGKMLLKDSVLIVDPDVPEDEIKKEKYEFLLKFPSDDSLCLPIEKRIVKYISSLPGDNSYFKSINMEKMGVESTFSDFKINIKKVSTQKTALYKNWCARHSRYYKVALREYIKSNQTVFDKFRLDVIKAVNARRNFYSLPPLTLKS